MGINFPNTPTLGDIWPTPSVVGQPQYTWDGEKWARGNVPTSRASIYAAPFDALAYSGMQINGSMDVSQENGFTAVALPNGTPKYVIDGWYGAMGSSTGAVSASMLAAGPTTPITSGVYFTNLLIMKATTALGASDYAFFSQMIEGWRCARLGWGTSAAQPLTIGFWVFTPIAGTLSVFIRNAPTYNRSYVASVSTAGGVWEYKTVTIPGDTTGTWPKDNTTGIQFGFSFAVTSSLCSAPGAGWTATGNVGVTGTTNFLNAVNNAVYITGVVVLPGVEAPSAARSALIMRPYDQELLTCKRYWQSIGDANFYPVFGSNSYSSANVIYNFPFPIAMRAAPSGLKNGTWSVANAGQPSINTTSANGAVIIVPVVGAGVYTVFPNGAGQNFTFDARL
jgi:hypothetical protein